MLPVKSSKQWGLISTYIFTDTTAIGGEKIINLPSVIISGTIIYIYFASTTGQLALIPTSPDIFININSGYKIVVSPTGCAVLISSNDGLNTGYYSISNLGAGITYVP